MPFVWYNSTFDHLTRFYFNLTNETTLVKEHGLKFFGSGGVYATKFNCDVFCSKFYVSLQIKDFPIFVRSRIQCMYLYSKTYITQNVYLYVKWFFIIDRRKVQTFNFKLYFPLLLYSWIWKANVLNILKLVMWIWFCHYNKKVWFCYMCIRRVCLFLFMGFNI